MPIASAMTYTLVVLLAALVAKGRATGRDAIVRCVLAAGIMLAPRLGDGIYVLMASPDHIGSTVPVMAAFLLLDRAPGPAGRPVAASLLLSLAQVADALVFFVGIAPLALVCAFRALRRSRRLQAGAAAAHGKVAASRIDRTSPAAPSSPPPSGTLVHPLPSTPRAAPSSPVNTGSPPVGAVVTLPVFGACSCCRADFIGLPKSTTTFFVMLHVVDLALAAYGIAVAAWRFLGRPHEYGMLSDRDRRRDVRGQHARVAGSIEPEMTALHFAAALASGSAPP